MITNNQIARLASIGFPGVAIINDLTEAETAAPPVHELPDCLLSSMDTYGPLKKNGQLGFTCRIGPS